MENDEPLDKKRKLNGVAHDVPIFVPKRILKGHLGPVTSVKVSPNGKLIASSCKILTFSESIST
jgi:WD40 repeat protein